MKIAKDNGDNDNTYFTPDNSCAVACDSLKKRYSRNSTTASDNNHRLKYLPVQNNHYYHQYRQGMENSILYCLTGNNSNHHEIGDDDNSGLIRSARKRTWRITSSKNVAPTWSSKVASLLALLTVFLFITSTIAAATADAATGSGNYSSTSNNSNPFVAHDDDDDDEGSRQQRQRSDKLSAKTAGTLFNGLGGDTQAEDSSLFGNLAESSGNVSRKPGNDDGNEDDDPDNYLHVNHNGNKKHYTHQWAVHIVGGPEVAKRVAEKHGFHFHGEILQNYYHLTHSRVAKRSIEPHTRYHGRLATEPEVRWLQQQTVKRRVKRDFLPKHNEFKQTSSSSLSSSLSDENSSGQSSEKRNRVSKKGNGVLLNDPRWSAMWYLNRGGGLDMNVLEAWNEGITGKGIVVTILDDGLEKDHPDIVRNYDPMASFDVNSLDPDPMPTYDLTDSNRHGTRCAGEVAAEANNSLCAVGIAYEAGVGGVRMLDGDVTDAVEARSLSLNPQHIDIYSASWGPDDDGKTVDGPGVLAMRAFMEGVTKGRNGKGSIFVWASGNGGRDHDNCNCDGYTNSIWTLSISSATENGLVPWYSEACSSTLASTYSSGGTGEKQIVTIDLHHSCTSSHTGTSASAPLAAGICALALQANTNLTWRDMQHIVVRTAKPLNLIANDWAMNGVGRNVSHSFGYGLMDAGAMVKLAKKWEMVPEQHKCEIKAPYTDKNIPSKSKVTLDLKVTHCPNVNYLEHVQAKVTLTSGRRGDLQIFLISPAGTKSQLLAHRRHDLNRAGFTDWPFMTVHSWGESPVGKWTLEIHNEGRYADSKGRTVLKRWSLVFYGTEEDIGIKEGSTENSNGKFSAGNAGGGIEDFSSYLVYTSRNSSVAFAPMVVDVLEKKDDWEDASRTSFHLGRSKSGRPRGNAKDDSNPAPVRTSSSSTLTRPSTSTLQKAVVSHRDDRNSEVAANFDGISTKYEKGAAMSISSLSDAFPRNAPLDRTTDLLSQSFPATNMHSQNGKGKIHTWSLIARGIASNQNVVAAGKIGSAHMANSTQRKSFVGSDVNPFDDNKNASFSAGDYSLSRQNYEGNVVEPVSIADPRSSTSASSNCAKMSAPGQCLGWCLLLLSTLLLPPLPTIFRSNYSSVCAIIITSISLCLTVSCHIFRLACRYVVLGLLSLLLNFGNHKGVTWKHPIGEIFFPSSCTSISSRLSKNNAEDNDDYGESRESSALDSYCIIVDNSDVNKPIFSQSTRQLSSHNHQLYQCHYHHHPSTSSRCHCYRLEQSPRNKINAESETKCVVKIKSQLQISSSKIELEKESVDIEHKNKINDNYCYQWNVMTWLFGGLCWRCEDKDYFIYLSSCVLKLYLLI